MADYVAIFAQQMTVQHEDSIWLVENGQLDELIEAVPQFLQHSLDGKSVQMWLVGNYDGWPTTMRWTAVMPMIDDHCDETRVVKVVWVRFWPILLNGVHLMR